MMSNGTSSALNSEQDLDSIPMAGGGLSRLAIARLQSAGVPVAPLLRRVGLTPEVIADPEERLSVRSQVVCGDHGQDWHDGRGGDQRAAAKRRPVDLQH